MADVHDKATRSKNMRAIATENTAIERRLRQLLDEQGFDYLSQVTTLPGRPDFVVPDFKAVIFTHGCFWHQHHCHLFKLPATRTAFWQQKIAENVSRDQRCIKELSAQGWKVLVIWECALRGKLKLSDSILIPRIEEWICAGSDNAGIDTAGISNMTLF